MCIRDSCGYCGAKMTNGSKYNYWVIKETGEKRSGRTYIYKCPLAYQGTPHEKSMVLRADKIEPIVFSAIAEYIGCLLYTSALQAAENGCNVKLVSSFPSERAQS